MMLSIEKGRGCNPATTLKKRINFFILFLILVSSFEIILESVVSFNLKYYHHFFIIDTAVSILFSIEYIRNG